MKNLTRVLAIVLVICMIASCGGKTTAPAASTTEPAAQAAEAPKAERPSTMVIASGNSGGTYYYIGAGQAKILTDKLGGISVTTEATSGSPVENGTFVQTDPTYLGIITLDGVYEGHKGNTDRGFSNGPIDKVALVQVGHPLILYCVALQGSGIESIADLKGKRVSLPTVGNTAYFQAVAIMEKYGVTLKDCTATPMQYAEAGDALKDGTLDAIWVAGGIPQAAVSDLDTTKDITFVSIEDDKVQEILEAFPYWGIQTLKAGTYADMDKDCNCMTAVVCMFANLDADEDLIYDITKILNESTDELAVIHQDGANWNTDRTLEIMERGIVPVHPGAQRYYDEVTK